MSTVTLTLAEYVGLLAAVLAAGIGVGWAIERERVKRRRQAWQEKNRSRARAEAKVTEGPWAPTPTVDAAPQTPDAADQLRIVMGASFSVQPLLNKSEARVFRELDQYVLSCNPGWQVMAQVSLGRDPAQQERRGLSLHQLQADRSAAR